MSKILIGRSDTDLDYPICRPSLDLDFTQEVLDPRITFTRGSIGTRVNRNRLIETVSANVPRFDYDPISGECRGLLIEESRSNNILQSENFSTTWTTFQSSVSTNVTTAPDGSNNADILIPNGGASIPLVRQDMSGLADTTTYTLSCFFKTAGLTSISFQFFNKANTFHGSKILNLSNGTLSNNDTIGTSSVVNYGNGWYRLILTNLGSGTGATTPTIRFFCNSLGSGSSTSGIYIWGAQLEAGAFPTSYIPTTASTVTRSADVATMTGTNFSSWYNQSEGTFISNCITRRSDTGNVADFAVLNSTNTNRIVSWFNTPRYPLFSVLQNNNTVFLPTTNAPSNQSNVSVKKAISLADKNMRVATQGKLITGDLGNNGVQDYLPTDFNRMLIGHEGIFAGYFGGTISRLTYYPRALKPNQLQLLTQ